MRDDLQRVEQRFGISIPTSYSDLARIGALTWIDPEQVDRYLFLTDLEWLTASEIAEYEFISHYSSIVPFAISARRDEWAWYPEWPEAGEPAVVLREPGISVAGYAPTFEAFLFRRLLEELAGTWLPDDPGFGPDGAHQQIRRNIELVRPVLRTSWYETLKLRVGSSAMLRESQEGEWALISAEEARSVAAQEIQWSHLDEEFEVHD